MLEGMLAFGHELGREVLALWLAAIAYHAYRLTTSKRRRRHRAIGHARARRRGRRS
jgi:hypothetical protein